MEQQLSRCYELHSDDLGGGETCDVASRCSTQYLSFVICQERGDIYSYFLDQEKDKSISP